MQIVFKGSLHEIPANFLRKIRQSAELAKKLVTKSYFFLELTHFSLETPKWVICKQCRPRLNATEHGI